VECCKNHDVCQTPVRSSFLGVKRPGREADSTSLSSIEVKMRGTIPTLPQISARHGA
jgi:hypothetical protein